QVIASLLTLQGRAAGPGEARARLQESAERVKAMALVHEQLYRSTDLGGIAMSSFMNSLLENLRNIYSTEARGISITSDVTTMAVGVDYAVPLGLIAHELVSNACKHAFPEGVGGAIRVALKPVGGDELELEVSDDGRGLPEGWSAEGATTLGSHLVAALSRQIGGTFRQVAAQGGACFRVRFPRPARGVESTAEETGAHPGSEVDRRRTPALNIEDEDSWLRAVTEAKGERKQSRKP